MKMTSIQKMKFQKLWDFLIIHYFGKLENVF
jgi:hypothetical protein